jgi:hypothetical protein
MTITLREGSSQSKISCLMFTWDWSHRLAFPLILLKVSDNQTSTEARQEGVKRWDSSLWTHDIVDLWQEVPNEHAVPVWNVIIHNGVRRWSWTPGSTIRRVVHDDDLEHPTHEQEVWLTMTIGFEFTRSLKNSAITFQAVVRQLITTDPIDGPTRPQSRTSSTTTRSSGLPSLRSEQWSMKNKQSRSYQFLQQVFNDQQIYNDKI